MKKLSGLAIAGIIIGALLLITIFSIVGIYNGLVNSQVGVDQSWGQVQSVYQRRADLIPNLVSTVQGSVKFEQETQTKIAELRTGAESVKGDIQNAKTPNELDVAGQKLNDIISGYKSLNINVENYPDLKSSQNFLALQDELAGTENRINVERQRFNEAVGNYNKRIMRFPSNIIAGMFGFEKREFFEAKEGADTVPEVKF